MAMSIVINQTYYYKFVYNPFMKINVAFFYRSQATWQSPLAGQPSTTTTPIFKTPGKPNITSKLTKII